MKTQTFLSSSLCQLILVLLLAGFASLAAASVTRDIQIFLTDKGYPTGGLDGICGPKTRAAISDYLGMENTGSRIRCNQAILQQLQDRDRAGNLFTTTNVLYALLAMAILFALYKIMLINRTTMIMTGALLLVGIAWSLQKFFDTLVSFTLARHPNGLFGDEVDAFLNSTYIPWTDVPLSFFLTTATGNFLLVIIMFACLIVALGIKQRLNSRNDNYARPERTVDIDNEAIRKKLRADTNVLLDEIRGKYDYYSSKIAYLVTNKSGDGFFARLFAYDVDRGFYLSENMADKVIVKYICRLRGWRHYTLRVVQGVNELFSSISIPVITPFVTGLTAWLANHLALEYQIGVARIRESGGRDFSDASNIVIDRITIDVIGHPDLQENIQLVKPAEKGKSLSDEGYFRQHINYAATLQPPGQKVAFQVELSEL